MKKLALFLIVGLSISTFAAQHEDSLKRALGPKFKPNPQAEKGKAGPKKGIDAVRRWNEVSTDATGFDHGAAREQLGPGRSSRALAIVHIAMFDAANAVIGGYESYTGVQAPKGPISVDAAISQAAHDTLVALFPAQTATFDTQLATDLAGIKNGKEKANGIALGQQVAEALMAGRANDGSEILEPRVGIEWPMNPLPGHWRQDPISLIPLAMGAYWGQCAPFVVESSSQFRCPPAPALDSLEFTEAYWEVKLRGGDGITTPTLRTPEQTFIGIFWAYDGTPSLCAPPKLYNQIAVQIIDQSGVKLSGVDLARFLAVVNVALSDATLTCWESKYYYDICRPVTGIREADGDGNPSTLADPTYSPLGAPASNLMGPNFTPPFPAYPSGHATMGGALFQTLRRFFGTDDVPFTFISDEYNGETRANDGSVRPLLPRSYPNFSVPEEENGQSRIYLGIHWSFDKTEGIAMGRKVGNYIFDNAFRPVKKK